MALNTRPEGFFFYGGGVGIGSISCLTLHLSCHFFLFLSRPSIILALVGREATSCCLAVGLFGQNMPCMTSARVRFYIGWMGWDGDELVSRRAEGGIVLGSYIIKWAGVNQSSLHTAGGCSSSVEVSVLLG